MAQDGNIGAARISLVVDADDYLNTLKRGKSAAAEFGEAAERAFEQSTGKSRTAQQRLLDYVSTLGAASTEQQRFLSLLSKASGSGAQDAVLKAATKGYNDYATSLELTRIKTEAWEQGQKRATVAARELANEEERAVGNARQLANERARMYVEGRAAQQTVNAQSNINSLLGVQTVDNGAQARRRADAEAALLPILQRQEAEYKTILLQQKLIEAETNDIRNETMRWKSQIDAVGKDYYQLAEAQARARYGSRADPIIEQIRQYRDLNTSISGTTVNAKQLQQAIRFLPAQFTDIGVSLAGGMNPLLVAFQQGGQILDQFRLAGASTGDTFRMIGSYASKLITPVTVGVGALAALAYAGYDAAKSMEELAIASVKGYGAAGNAEALYATAEALNRIENVRLGPAEQAVARLAATGRLAGENFDLAAEATARWSSLSGEAADRVAGQFEAIARDPLQAIESGLVRVTQAQYEQIRALVVQGDQQGAVNALVKIFYDTINNNSAQVEAHLSGVSRYMNSIKDGFGEATRAAGGYFNSIFGWMAEYEATYQRLVKEGSNPFVAQIRAFNTDPQVPKKPTAASAALFDPSAAARAKAQALEVAEFLATADEKAQREITIRRIEANGKRLNIDYDVTAQIIARQEKLWAAADAKKNKGGSRGGTGARTAARDVRYDYQLESALLQTQTREVQAAYAVKQITAESYYASLIKFAQQEFDIQKRSNAEQLAAIGGKKGQEHEVARLRVADAIAEQQLAQRIIDIQSQQAQYTEQLTREREAYSKALRDGVQAQQEEFQVALNRLTMGDKEFERWNAENELRREGIRLWEEATRWAKENPNQVEEGQRRVQAAIQATNDKLNQTAAAYANIDAAQADWANGASKAWKNWRDDVSDVSAHAEKVTTESLDTLADLTTDALTGNLKSWGDYFDGIAYMITQFIVKQQLTKWIESIGKSSGGGGFWDKAAGLFAGLLGGGGGFQASSNGVSGQQFADVFSDGGAFGFAKGGFTGHGADNEIAGLVHKNEYVVPAPVVRAIRSGRTGGTAPAAAGPRNVTINQHNKFEMASDRTTRAQYLRDQAKLTNKALAKV